MILKIYAIRHFLEGINQRYSEKRIVREFKGSKVQPKVLAHQVNGRLLRYTQTDPSGTPEAMIVFVHGAPGGTEAFFKYLQDPRLNQRCRLISVDRLGYGGSGLGWAEPSIIQQATSIQPIIDAAQIEGLSTVLVGHSFGGPICARIAMQNPGIVKGLLLLAPALDPENERKFWVTKLGKFPPTRWITPVGLRVAADEKWVHPSALRAIEADWPRIAAKVKLLHGTDDMIVPFENLEYAKRMLKENQFEGVPIQGANHFIPWSKRRLITDHLIDLLEQVK